MISVQRETLSIQAEADIVTVRQVVRGWAQRLDFGIVDQSKLTTAASELARNTLVHGKGGTVVIEDLREGTKGAIRLTFQDHGPGIPDIDRAMQDGYTTGGGLGLGLGGTRRLMHEFRIESVEGRGTTVTITHHRRR